MWTDVNITKENFPNTYDAINTLRKFDPHSPYGKLASATDLMRHEILYNEGGFWKDAGMELLRPVFNKFLKCKVFITFTMQGWYRFIQGMCIFGNMPKS